MRHGSTAARHGTRSGQCPIRWSDLRGVWVGEWEWRRKGHLLYFHLRSVEPRPECIDCGHRDSECLPHHRQILDNKMSRINCKVRNKVVRIREQKTGSYGILLSGHWQATFSRLQPASSCAASSDVILRGSRMSSACTLQASGSFLSRHIHSSIPRPSRTVCRRYKRPVPICIPEQQYCNQSALRAVAHRIWLRTEFLAGKYPSIEQAPAQW